MVYMAGGPNIWGRIEERGICPRWKDERRYVKGKAGGWGKIQGGGKGLVTNWEKGLKGHSMRCVREKVVKVIQHCMMVNMGWSCEEKGTG